MRVKITRGADIRGGVNYDFNEGLRCVKGKVAVLIGGNMTGNTVDELVSEFASIRRLRPDIEKPVWKEALRATQGEDITANKWNEIAVDHMREIGLNPDKHPFIITQHVGEDHVHILALRVALDGTIYHGKNENLIASRDCQRLEKKYNLVRTSSAKYTVDEQGKHHIIMPGKTKPSSGEIQMKNRTGKPTPRERLQEIITTALKDRPTQQEYEKRLTAAGVSFKFSSNGYSYETEGIPFKGSQLGTAYKWAQLQRSFTTQEEIQVKAAREQQRAIHAAKAEAWTAEQKRRDRFRANRSITKSVGRFAAHILPRPLGEAVQIAAEVLSLLAKMNDWRQAHNYRKQVEQLITQLHQVKADRQRAVEARTTATKTTPQDIVLQPQPLKTGTILTTKTKIEKIQEVIQSPELTRSTDPNDQGSSPLGTISSTVPEAQSEALPPQNKNKHSPQQPAFKPVVKAEAVEPPALTAAEIKLLGQANWEILRYGENRREKELQAITHPGLDVDINRRPSPILVNGVPITEIEDQLKPAQKKGPKR